MHKLIFSFLILFIIIYPKFPLASITGSFVAVRFEDLIIFFTLLYLNYKLFKNTPIHRSIYIYLLIGFCAAFSGIFLTKTATLSQAILHFCRRIEYMSLFFVGYQLFDKKIYLNFLINLLLFSSLIVSIYGLGQQYFKFPIISTTNSEFSKGLALTLGEGARINSTFAGHYDLAAFMLIPLLLIMGLIFSSRHKIFLCLLWSVNYFVMLLSASRITFASLFISSVLLLYLIKKSKWIPIFIFISIFGFLFSPQLRGRYLDLITNYFHVSVVRAQETPIVRPVFAQAEALQTPAAPEDRSLSIRLNAEWPKALRAFYKNPIFGSGFSSIGLAADNEYLRLMAESGILGFISFVLIFVRYIKLIISRLENFSSTLENYFLATILCSVVGLLINALFIDIFTASKIALITWLLIGISVKIATTYDK